MESNYAHRRTALVAGLLYLLSFVSIPTLSLYKHIHQPDYLLSAGSDNGVVFGALLEIVVALSCVGSAIVLYPILRKQQQILALGLVAARILEAATIITGVAFLLTIVTLHQNGPGAASLPVSRALVILYYRIFLLGQSFMPAINDLLLGYLLYQSRLVPRTLAIIGMIGALPLIAGYLAIMFNLISRDSAWAGLSAVLVALLEFALGIYLLFNGFKPGHNGKLIHK